jgi:hypothetical protein
MKKLALVIGMVLVVAMPAVANVIWNEDFSSVADWSVIWNPSNDASVASDGSHGLFSEPSPGLGWPNGPAMGPTNRVAFDPVLKSDFTLGFTVTAISNSMSFDVGLDCFSNDYSYVETVWAVFPNQAFVGTTNINLGAFTFNAASVYVSPKITLHTGEGLQTVSFDSMSMDQQAIPEPASLALIVGGGLLAVLLRKRSR